MNVLKRLTEQEYYDLIEDHGHVLLREADGSIDYFGIEYEHHNGPRCVRCGNGWCQHCRDEITPCVQALSELFPLTKEDAIKRELI